MAYNPVGHIDLDSGQFVESSPGFLSPLRKAALGNWLVDNICELGGQFEAGYRNVGLNPLANMVAAGRRAGGCYTPGNEPSLEAEVPIQPTFTGGQCEGDFYDVAVTYINASGQVNNLGPYNRRGPIGESYATVADPDFRMYRITHLDGVTDVQLIRVANPPPGGQLDQISAAVTRQDGMPDVCGDPPLLPTVWEPGVELPPAPSPGDIIKLPEVLKVPIVIGGVQVNIDVEIGPVEFSLGGLTFSLGGVTFNLFPDFSVGGDESEFQDVCDSLDGVQNSIDSIDTKVDGIKDDVTLPLSGSITGFNCQDSELEVAYSGSGFDGIVSMLNAVVEVDQFTTLDTCEVPDFPNVERELIGTHLYTTSTETGIVLSVPGGAKFIEVSVVSGPIDTYLYKGVGSGDKQGRFGLFFWGYDDGNDIRWNEPKHIYFENSVFAVPDNFGRQLVFRVSSQPGFSLEFHDSGVR